METESILQELPSHRAPVTKHVLGTVQKSVVGPTHCRFTILRGHTPSERLLCHLLVGGPREAVIGMALPSLARMNDH